MTDLARLDDWDAEAYNVGSYLQNFCVNKILSEYVFRENIHLADLGCGDGESTANILNYAPRATVLGLDCSSKMISSAQANYTRQFLSFRKEDITRLNYLEEFDLITSFFCLDWIQDQKSLQQKIYRALKSQGQVLFVISTGEDNISRIVEDVKNNSKWKPLLNDHVTPVGLHNLKSYQKAMEQAGFTLCTFEIKRIPVELPAIHLFYQFIFALPLFGDVLSADENQQIIKDITAEFQVYCDRVHRGKLICDGEMIIVKATKAAS